MKQKGSGNGFVARECSKLRNSRVMNMQMYLFATHTEPEIVRQDCTEK